MVVIESTEKVDPETAYEALARRSQEQGFILGYIRLGDTAVEMVTVAEYAFGEPSGRQREVRALHSEARFITEESL